ncbi:MAG: hypothetical protein COZ69_10675 [Deltaproteobacteria bacterium CG_4_8_14_3_um_filter_45_9]|nr:MAG: hypothetical protein COS40_11125 [Deltaproteobacteria bacterium CG03_land_8_20_14_0_80_45_14]PIX22597.1 MAG: hypothetical protein COZ69_10675 [Deltaproteobacteria bacterium CG_4_8_14_3_um_filter_45_9]
MKVKSEYLPREIEACVIVMRDLFTYLKPYRNQIVLIGGWVPYFLLEKYAPPGIEYDRHVGSLDVDIALNAFSIPRDAYKSILEILKERGFHHRKDSLGKNIPARFLKKIAFDDGEEIEVQIDFLAPEYGGAPKKRRHQVIQDMLARKGRGTDIVFDQTEIIHLSGPISSGANIELDIKVANVTACFVMKGIALGERTSEKDAYDLYMLARYYKEGPQSVLFELKKLGSHGLMKESLRNIEEQFKEVKSIGPVSVATFMGITDKEEYDRITRDAYELLQFIIRGMKNK